MQTQAVRGSGASFGIVTSFVFATEPVPPLGGTTFQFTWDLPPAEASSALASFQDFVTGDMPSTLGGEIVLMRGSAHGNVSFQFFGVHWDDPETFEDTVSPFVSQFRTPDNTTMTQGDWMTVLKAWVYGDMDTATGVHPHDNFYAKSVMVPEATGLSQASMDAFIEYLATDGYDTELVSEHSPPLAVFSPKVGLVRRDRALRRREFCHQRRTGRHHLVRPSR